MRLWYSFSKWFKFCNLHCLRGENMGAFCLLSGKMPAGHGARFSFKLNSDCGSSLTLSPCCKPAWFRRGASSRTWPLNSVIKRLSISAICHWIQCKKVCIGSKFAYKTINLSGCQLPTNLGQLRGCQWPVHGQGGSCWGSCWHSRFDIAGKICVACRLMHACVAVHPRRVLGSCHRGLACSWVETVKLMILRASSFVSFHSSISFGSLFFCAVERVTSFPSEPSNVLT